MNFFEIHCLAGTEAQKSSVDARVLKQQVIECLKEGFKFR